jgi:alpha-L-arabinofuranosidase
VRGSGRRALWTPVRAFPYASTMQTPGAVANKSRDLLSRGGKSFLIALVLSMGLYGAALRVNAQSSLPVYDDSLVNGFQDWGWATHNYANVSPVHSGTRSVSVTINAAWVGLQIYHPDLDSSLYSSVRFWLHGGSSGGQRLKVYGLLHIGSSANVSQSSFVLSTLTANTWQQFTIPLSALGVANTANFTGFVIQDNVGAIQPTFYVDDIELVASLPPAVTHLSVNASQTLRTADARWYAANTAIWDGNFNTPTTISLLREMGTRVLRFPGGSLSDEYYWASNTSGTNTWRWSTSFANFVHVATNIGAQAFITVNYGSGSASQAAAWVRHANVTNHLGFAYWEIGNECYGTWETDTNANAHDAYTYAVRAKDYYQQMKAADPTIKVGVVAAPGEDSYINGFTGHPVVNPRTGQTHNGWTPVLLATLKTLGITPDFIVHHRYPQWTDKNNPVGSDSDPALLQCSGAWAVDAADLRQQIADYFGPSGTNIELVCTENNSDSGAQGKQSTSLVNGLYYADSLAQLMKTELNAFVWWDLRNGTDATGCFDASLYGWRTYGDLGMINGLGTRHPTFYAAKLMQYFVQPGDTILAASSDYAKLAAYAARPASGAMSLLVINKEPATNLTAQVVLAGFVPSALATLRSYGIPQDEAARTNGTMQAQDIAVTNFTSATTNFSITFPAYSLSLLALAPAAPSLTVLPVASAPKDQIVLQLRGQPGVRYFLQSSSDLANWSTVSTNTLASDSLMVTNTVTTPPAGRFWRAVWQF